MQHDGYRLLKNMNGNVAGNMCLGMDLSKKWY